MQEVRRAEDEATNVALELRRDASQSPYDSLELSDGSDDNTSSQAESDLSLPLSTHERKGGNQYEDVLQHDINTGDRDLWQERLKKAAFHLGNGSGNQDEDSNQIDESSSDHSIIESESLPARDDSSLSLSKSSSSEFEADEPIPWLDSELSESSSCDGDALRAVVIASDDQKITRASSSSDARWLSDSSSQSSSTFEPHWVEDEEEDEQLWEAFNAALQSHRKLNAVKIEVDDHTQDILDDEAYDASVSASSLDDSDDESTGDEYPRRPSPQSFLPRLSVGYDTSSNVDSLASLPSSPSGKTNSSISSLDVMPCEELLHPPDPLLDPLSSSCDEDPLTRGSRWIENIPAGTQASILGTAPSHELPGGLEQPRFWRHDEFIVAEEYGIRQPRRRGGFFADANSVESLCDDEEDASMAQSPTVKPHSHQQPQRRYSNLHEIDAYVGYKDLAGIFELHAPRYPAVIIDLGCGTSRLCAELVFHGHRFIYGIDCDPVVVDFQRHCSAAAELKDFVRFLPMSAESLAFPDESSDFIVSKATFDEMATRCLRQKHPQELLQALKEAIRCLKTGGVLMVVAFQDQYSVDGDDTSQCGLPDDATPIERASHRLQTPWWKWVEIESLFGRELTLIAQYELGCPTQRDGTKTKPYCVLVWRRKESKTQRLRRLADEIRQQKRMEREYRARIQLMSGKILQDLDEQKMVKETRQMIMEDELSGRQRLAENQVEAVRQRLVRRAAFYAALIEDERQTMASEDVASTMRREHEISAVTFVMKTIAQIVDAVFVAVAVAPSVATLVSLEPVSKDNSMQQPSTLETEATSTEKVTNDVWIRNEVRKMVDAALAAMATKELRNPVQRRRRVQQPTQALVEPAPASDVAEANQAIERSAPVDAVETETVCAPPPSEAATDPHDVAQQTVAWIVSRAIASISQATGPSIVADVDAVQHVVTRAEPSASVNPTGPGVESENCLADPSASVQPQAEEHFAEKTIPNPATTTATTTRNEGVSSSDGDREALEVCEAVLDAIVGQVEVGLAMK